VYFGQGSTRWSLKAYHKADELVARGRGHRLPDELPHRERLFSWAIGVVRFEVTLRTKELEKLESIPRTPVEALAVWQTYFDKVTWNQNARMVESDMFESGLRGELRKTLALWRAGVDLRDMLSRNTYYKHRRQLLDQVGVDIASPPPPKVPAAADAPTSALDPKGWDPEPLEGYAWNPTKRLLA